MSRQIFGDIEEALSREVRRITFHNQRTLSRTVLPDSFDPFTGEIIQTNLEADYYDSSVNANFIQYPNIFIRLLKTREDLSTGRILPPYGNWVQTPIATAPKAYEIVIQGHDGYKPSAGNTIDVTSFKIKRVQIGQYLRLLNGNNKGTYIISAITINNIGPHTITVSPILLQNLPILYFNPVDRVLNFDTTIDLNTIKVGDDFIDNSNTIFTITALDLLKNSITLGGVGNPDLNSGAKIERSGNILQNPDSSPVSYLIVDPTKPISRNFSGSICDATSGVIGLSPQIPIDIYYLVRIDSKERQTHIDILNRVWEEFNPPRTGLATIIRSALSYEQFLTVDVTTGGSNTINIKDNSNFNINDPVFIFDKFVPTQNNSHGFSGEFASKIIGKISTNQLVLSDVVPDTFTVDNEAKIVSNATLRILMFNFVDHNTKDIEAAQYWVHEFTYWVQGWVDRLESASEYDGVIQRIGVPIEDLQGNLIIDDDP